MYSEFLVAHQISSNFHLQWKKWYFLRLLLSCWDGVRSERLRENPNKKLRFVYKYWQNSRFCNFDNFTKFFLSGQGGFSLTLQRDVCQMRLLSLGIIKWSTPPVFQCLSDCTRVAILMTRLWKFEFSKF